MNVEIKVTQWKIRVEEKTNQPVIEGKYDVLMGSSVLATQDFNCSYGLGKNFPFSNDLTQKLKALEKDIVAEIQGLIS